MITLFVGEGDARTRGRKEWKRWTLPITFVWKSWWAQVSSSVGLFALSGLAGGIGGGGGAGGGEGGGGRRRTNRQLA